MKNDFSQGKVWKNIVNQALPLMLAQLVQLLYNIVDRVYIGHLPENGSMALTGIGLIFPLVTLITAFTNLFSTGGTPLFSIARGAKNEERAGKIMGNTAALLLSCSIILTFVSYVFRRPILYLFGAGDASYQFADAYLKIYLIGTPFTMFAAGMNNFINAQGFPKTGMLSIVIGAVLNLILDPVFIFGMKMGVAGAALATIISQIVSAAWVMSFFIGKRALIRLSLSNMKIDIKLLGEILTLGIAGFIMQGTNSLVQAICNVTLRTYGGELYVGVMTVINSVREILTLPAHSITAGAQPVLGFNYGAKKYGRVKEGIRICAYIGAVYTTAAWLFVVLTPKLLISIFTNDPVLINVGISALRIYFFGFVFMSLQFAGQSTFTSLGCAKRAILFSLLRKVVIVVPMTLLLPTLGLGVDGVFWAEPISNIIGGAACGLTMYFTIYRKLEDTKQIA